MAFTPTPDLPGYREALNRLRELTGATVVFVIPPDENDTVWPPGTSFDTETGDPMDPLIEPDSMGDETEVPIKADVAFRLPRDMSDDTRITALGAISERSFALFISVADKPSVEDATEVEVYGKRYAITQWTTDGIDIPDRWIVFIEEKS